MYKCNDNFRIFLCLKTGDKGEHGEAEGDRGIEAGGKAEAELAPGNGAL